ncbi:dTDP-4-dehydrorhamnose reductase [Maribacter spongiicola]|uniref:dTDP-4-dehydrorhamnose reductase n=1 Tax=Maribacter spongiicola TaxID=1206753 RepID=A0A4R7K7F2_9FLAO|nr:dTDP-4-dehydrorhamnose reductase [Maribacter spongiicola]TDT46338.1 dTDP-4-dehydrorhamnose reductase [Maribacter spongiicola]
MKNILVTGGNGQLATCLKEVSEEQGDLNFLFVSSKQLDITDYNAVNDFFNKNDISYCINCAAYTAVDKAETDEANATKVNVDGARNLSKVCSLFNTILIHISTDFVFDGEKTSLYSEEDKETPICVYGQTKLKGEIAIAESWEKHIIIRTSWLYSEYGNNFLKTMLRLGSERDKLGVVVDQIGTPTYAVDLAKVIVAFIDKESIDFGTFHFSNEGVASWYDFAKSIFDISKTKVELAPIKSEAYPTPAKRPSFSVMDKSKIKNELDITIPYWRDSLKIALKNLS